MTTLDEREPGSSRIGRLAKLASISFWGTLASLIVGASAAAGFAILFALPLLALGYLVVCMIALRGDRRVE